jgi:hypothetical protein
MSNLSMHRKALGAAADAERYPPFPGDVAVDAKGRAL